MGGCSQGPLDQRQVSCVRGQVVRTITIPAVASVLLSYLAGASCRQRRVCSLRVVHTKTYQVIRWLAAQVARASALLSSKTPCPCPHHLGHKANWLTVTRGVPAGSPWTLQSIVTRVLATCWPRRHAATKQTWPLCDFHGHCLQLNWPNEAHNRHRVKVIKAMSEDLTDLVTGLYYTHFEDIFIHLGFQSKYGLQKQLRLLTLPRLLLKRAVFIKSIPSVVLHKRIIKNKHIPSQKSLHYMPQ